jgi:hypothetical protein
MRTDVEGRVIEYFFLEELLLLIFIHIAFQEVEGSICFLDFDGFALPLLLLEDGAQVSIFSVVLASLHRLLLN